MEPLNIIKLVAGDDSQLNSALMCLWHRGKEKLIQLYGDDHVDVIQKCFQVSPYFCFQVVTNVYAIWWQLDVLTDYEKSLVTCCALLATKQLNQFSVLINTFYISGGDEVKLSLIVNYMLKKRYVDVKTVDLIECSDSQINQLSDEEMMWIDLAAIISLQGDIDDFKHRLANSIDKNRIIVAINHLITYIGCPKVWNGTLKLELEDEYNL